MNGHISLKVKKRCAFGIAIYARVISDISYGTTPTRLVPINIEEWCIYFTVPANNDFCFGLYLGKWEDAGKNVEEEGIKHAIPADQIKANLIEVNHMWGKPLANELVLFKKADCLEMSFVCNKNLAFGRAVWVAVPETSTAPFLPSRMVWYPGNFWRFSALFPIKRFQSFVGELVVQFIVTNFDLFDRRQMSSLDQIKVSIPLIYNLHQSRWAVYSKLFTFSIVVDITDKINNNTIHFKTLLDNTENLKKEIFSLKRKPEATGPASLRLDINHGCIRVDSLYFDSFFDAVYEKKDPVTLLLEPVVNSNGRLTKLENNDYKLQRTGEGEVSLQIPSAEGGFHLTSASEFSVKVYCSEAGKEDQEHNICSAKSNNIRLQIVDFQLYVEDKVNKAYYVMVSGWGKLRLAFDLRPEQSVLIKSE